MQQGCVSDAKGQGMQQGCASDAKGQSFCLSNNRNA